MNDVRVRMENEQACKQKKRIYERLDDFLGVVVGTYEDRVEELDPRLRRDLLPLLAQGLDAYVISVGSKGYLILALLRYGPSSILTMQSSVWDEYDDARLATAETPEDVCRILQIATPYWIEFCPSDRGVADWLDSFTAQRIGCQIAERDVKRYPFELVASLVEVWIPRQRYTTEEGYKAELAQYLRGYGIPAAQEQGSSRADIVAAEHVAIALKKNPDSRHYDVLFGQIYRHLDEYEFAIAVIVALNRADAFDAFAKMFTNDARVKCVAK